MKRKYADALVNEIKLRAVAMREKAEESGHDEKDALLIDTVYFGGGTPSVIGIPQIRDIMHAVKTSFDVKQNAEITIEVNPGTLGADESEVRDRLSAYRSMGFNRLSMGVQSMDNNRLHFLGRIHTAEDVSRDVRLARETGFDNINLDLIFSVPGSTSEDALIDLKAVIDMEPEHISCYSLQIEEDTPFCNMISRGEISEVPDEEDRETYHKICRILKDKGYEHYEISNFAKMSAEAAGSSQQTCSLPAPGFGDVQPRAAGASPYRSKHNSLYWDMSEYIGCGLGASGFICGARYKNISSLDGYIKLYGKAGAITARDIEKALEESHVNSKFDNISEAVFTGLRRREGVSYDEAVTAYLRTSGSAESLVCKKPGSQDNEKARKDLFWNIFADAKSCAEDYAERGMMIIDEGGFRLTEKGIDISNSIMSMFV